MRARFLVVLLTGCLTLFGVEDVLALGPNIVKKLCNTTVTLREKKGTRTLRIEVSNCNEPAGTFDVNVSRGPDGAGATKVAMTGDILDNFQSLMNFAADGEIWSILGSIDSSCNVELALSIAAPLETIEFVGVVNAQTDAGIVTAQSLGNRVAGQFGAITDSMGAGFGFGGGTVAQVGVVPIAGGLRYQSQGAGDGSAYPWSLWGSYQYSDYEDEFAASAFDADSHGLFVGADFSPWDNWIFGAMLGYEDVESDTTFNNGSLDSDGFTIAPYFGVLLTDHLGVDFDLSANMAIGYASIDHDQTRNIGGTIVTGSTESERYFFAANVIAGRGYGNWYVTAQTGLLVAREEIDSFTDSSGFTTRDDRVDLGQLNIGGDVAYSWGSFEPFASAVFLHDYNHEDIGGGHPDDKNELQVGIGIRYFSASGFTGSAEYTKSFLRDDFDSDTITLTIRAEF